jgi:16S rRNA (cytosine1402-N4)-methyltransferase
MIHNPVLLGEAIENLKLEPGMTVVDGTLGAGGHSEAILKKIIPGGRLISIDWDRRAIENFEKKLQEGFFVAKRELICPAEPLPVNIKNKIDDQASFTKLGNRRGKVVGYWRGAVGNFANLREIIRGLGVKTVDRFFVDLGFSSDQVEDPKRGFSFSKSGPLDMRFSPEQQIKTAADIVNGYSEKELTRILREFGEEKFAERIAKEIVKRRRIGEIRRTGELVEVVSKAVPEKFKRKKIHFATKVFQALRIETNQELENLKKFLEQAIEVLASKGILAVISFHSLEDRIVKNFFRKVSRGCICPPNFPKCACGRLPRLKIITRKPIMAGAAEIEENLRSRSAKLRVAQKI